MWSALTGKCRAAVIEGSVRASVPSNLLLPSSLLTVTRADQPANIAKPPNRRAALWVGRSSHHVA